MSNVSKSKLQKGIKRMYDSLKDKVDKGQTEPKLQILYISDDLLEATKKDKSLLRSLK